MTRVEFLLILLAIFIIFLALAGAMPFLRGY